LTGQAASLSFRYFDELSVNKKGARARDTESERERERERERKRESEKERKDAKMNKHKTDPPLFF